MAPTLSPTRLYTIATDTPYSSAVLLALAANFIWADGHNQQRCIELIVLGMALVFALIGGALQRAFQVVPDRQRSLCLAFLILGALATIGVVSPRHAAAEWAIFVLLGSSAILVAAEVAATGTPGLIRLLKPLGVICLFYTLRGLLVYGAAMAARVQLDYHALAVGFSNVRFLNHAQTALLPLLVLLVRQPGLTQLQARACFMIAAFWWALIFVSEARATALGLASGVLIALILRRHTARQWLLTLAATAITGLVLYLVLYIVLPWALGMAPFGTLSNILARSAADPASGRQFLWARALALIAAHPLLGVGPQHFAHHGSDMHIGAHPHNWVFQIASEWGIPAWLCLLALLLLGGRALIRAAARLPPAAQPQQDIATTFIVAISAIVVDGLFSGVLVMPQSQLAIVLVVGMAIGWVHSLHPALMLPVAARTRYTGTLLGMVALAAIVLVIAPDASCKWQNTPLDAAEQAHNEGVHWPRLWDAGFF